MKRSKISNSVLSLIGLLFAAGCGYDLAEFNTIRPDHESYVIDLGARKVDVLFVIDNSGSMSDEQATLARSMPRFIAEFTGKPIDYQIGVITTDADKLANNNGVYRVRDENGHFVYTSPSGETFRDNRGNPAPMQIAFSSAFFHNGIGSLHVRRVGFNGASLNLTSDVPKFLSKSMGTSTVNQRFALDAQPGTEGSGNEAPLLSLVHFLKSDRVNGWNKGFLRSDSLFSVVIVTDEDESRTICNSNSPDPFVRSAECSSFAEAKSYVINSEAAKSARLNLFNTEFQAQRPNRPSLLSLDAVVALGESNACGGEDIQVNNGRLIQEVAESYKLKSTEKRVHDICQQDFSSDIGSIGNTIANSVERIFELKEKNIIASSIVVRVNGESLSETQFSYDKSKNRVTINDFGLDVGTHSGKLTIDIYYQKRLQLDEI